MVVVKGKKSKQKLVYSNNTGQVFVKPMNISTYVDVP